MTGTGGPAAAASRAACSESESKTRPPSRRWGRGPDPLPKRGLSAFTDRARPAHPRLPRSAPRAAGVRVRGRAAAAGAPPCAAGARPLESMTRMDRVRERPGPAAAQRARRDSSRATRAGSAGPSGRELRPEVPLGARPTYPSRQAPTARARGRRRALQVHPASESRGRPGPQRLRARPPANDALQPGGQGRPDRAHKTGSGP